MPRWRDIMGAKIPDYVGNNNFYRLNRGHDIKLAGGASEEVVNGNVSRFAVRPTDFRGIAPIPKMVVEERQEVLAGQELFFDKSNPQIKYVAPVSGEVVEIRRGAKRSISHVVILADKDQKYKSFNAPSLDAPVEELKQFFFDSGIWPLINQRPYDIVPDQEVTPENIFISGFNTAPLATNTNLIVKGNRQYLQKGIDVLNKMTSGDVHLGLDGRAGHKPSDELIGLDNVNKHWFDGKHPAGNVGVQNSSYQTNLRI